MRSRPSALAGCSSYQITLAIHIMCVYLSLQLYVSLYPHPCNLKAFCSQTSAPCVHTHRLGSNHALPISLLNSADWLLRARRCLASSPGPHPAAPHRLPRSLCVAPLPTHIHHSSAEAFHSSRTRAVRTFPDCPSLRAQRVPAEPSAEVPAAWWSGTRDAPAASQFLPRCHAAVKANATQTAGVSILSSSTTFVISLKKIVSLICWSYFPYQQVDWH